MVTEYGMSEKLGRLRYADNEEEVFLGHSVAQRKNVSDSTAQIIDEEIRRLVEEAEERARGVLTEHREGLDAVARALLEYETLSGDEVQRLLRGEEISRPEETPPPEDLSSATSVPSSSKKPKHGPGGMEPEPQPGS